MTNMVGTASALGEIRHTQDLIAAIASGQIRPGNIPPELDKASVRALVRAIYKNPHKGVHEPYITAVSAGINAKFTIANANAGIAPPLHQLPGPERIKVWMESGKLHTEKCRQCKAPIAIIEVSVGGKVGFFAVEDGEIRLDPPTLTEDDFLPPKQKFDPRTVFGAPKRRQN